MPETFLRERAVRALHGARLRLPGGTLTVDGIEFLCRAGQKRVHSDGESIEVPSGEYTVEVLNLMPWKETHRTAEINKQTSGIDRLVDKVVGAYTWLGVVLFPLNILFAPAAIVLVLVLAGWRQALTLAAAVVLADVLVLAGFWVLDAASRIFPTLRRGGDVRLAFETENPRCTGLPSKSNRPD